MPVETTPTYSICVPKNWYYRNLPTHKKPHIWLEGGRWYSLVRYEVWKKDYAMCAAAVRFTERENYLRSLI